MITVLIVDDQELIRIGLRGILSAHADLAVAEAADGHSALQYLRRSAVDVVLMDIRMPGMDGVETTSRIRREIGTIPRILILTTFENDETVVDAIRAGADGFIGKGIEPDALVEAIRALAAGRSPLSPTAGDALVRHAASPRPAVAVDAAMVARFSALTPRERHIVRAVARGRTLEGVAEDEHLSRYTVKTHLNRAMMKVGASDRAQLVAFAFRAGLVDDQA